MPIKFLKFTMNQNKYLFILSTYILISCQISTKSNKEIKDEQTKTQKNGYYCTDVDKQNNKLTYFERGDVVCPSSLLEVSRKEKLKIHYVTLNPKSDDPYEQGYYIFKRIISNKVVEKMNITQAGEPAWSFAHFVRIREGKYLADLDNDGYLEFAIFPFSPGSAAFGTIRIYSLKKKVIFWGLGKYHIEGDKPVLLNCDECSDFNLKACEKCQ